LVLLSPYQSPCNILRDPTPHPTFKHNGTSALTSNSRQLPHPFPCNPGSRGTVLTTATGANTPTTTGQHALRQGAGEEDGPPRGAGQEARAPEVAYQQDMDQYVLLSRGGGVRCVLGVGVREGGSPEGSRRTMRCWEWMAARELTHVPSPPRLRAMRRSSVRAGEDVLLDVAADTYAYSTSSVIG
jgi:hypothetical protein